MGGWILVSCIDVNILFNLPNEHTSIDIVSMTRQHKIFIGLQCDVCLLQSSWIILTDCK